MSSEAVNLDFLLKNNKQFTEQFKTNVLMILIQSHTMDDAQNRARLLDCVQVFSNYFQKTVMLRNVLNEDNRYLKIVQEHLAEEFGHDISLMHDRNNKQAIWDPVLDACSCWFSWKMLTLDNADKTLLVHLVLEASAHLFFKEAHRVMEQHAETNYFQIHAEVDEHHETMGLPLLDGLREIDYKHLLVIQQQGWDVLNTVCNRIAELTLGTHVGE